MKVRVTIGVCVKNGANLVENAISSIIDQDYPHELMEAIFVDDGSEDKTFSILSSFVPRMNMKARLFHHQWKGLGYSRNVVVNNANGEYIIWVDYDMTLPKDFVRKQVEFMDKNPDVAVGKGRIGLLATTNLVAYLENVEDLIELLEYESKMVHVSLGTGGAIYRVKAIRKIGGFNEKIKGVGEDLDIEHKIRESGWLLEMTAAEFCESARPRDSWRKLWEKYYWYGSGGRKVFNKINPHIMLYGMFPPTILLTVVSRSCDAYRLTCKKVVFLLPLQWVFKRIAWLIGFMRGRGVLS
jgi:glycosyltransferase involved in cell wall biosynthesis